MDGATVAVAVVASRTEAELIVGMLRSNGLRAVVSADDAGGVEPQLQLQGVRVLVAASDEAAARQLLGHGVRLDAFADSQGKMSPADQSWVVIAADVSYWRRVVRAQ